MPSRTYMETKKYRKSQIDMEVVQKSPAPLPAGRPGAGCRAL